MAAIRSNAGGQLLNQYLVARIFAFDDDESEARAACVAKGWDSVRRGPAWIAYASERAAKAAAAAVVACPAEAGSTCRICHDASNTEGLVRACSCAGAAGVAHLSCLVLEARNAAGTNRYERDENDNDDFAKWFGCNSCNAQGQARRPVKLALATACLAAYVNRPENDDERFRALSLFGYDAENKEEELQIREAYLAAAKRYFPGSLPEAKCEVASSLGSNGRHDEALQLYREAYAAYVETLGEDHFDTLWCANSLASAMTRVRPKLLTEAMDFLRDVVPVAEDALGPDHEYTLMLKNDLAVTLACTTPLRYETTRADAEEAVAILQNVIQGFRRLNGHWLHADSYAERAEYYLGQAQRLLGEAWRWGGDY